MGTNPKIIANLADRFLKLMDDTEIRKAVEDCNKHIDDRQGLVALAYAVSRAYFLGVQDGTHQAQESFKEFLEQVQEDY